MDALALPFLLIRKEALLAATGGAVNAVRPAQCDHEGGIVGFGEVDDGLLECLWAFSYPLICLYLTL